MLIMMMDMCTKCVRNAHELNMAAWQSRQKAEKRHVTKESIPPQVPDLGVEAAVMEGGLVVMGVMAEGWEMMEEGWVEMGEG